MGRLDADAAGHALTSAIEGSHLLPVVLEHHILVVLRGVVLQACKQAASLHGSNGVHSLLLDWQRWLLSRYKSHCQQPQPSFLYDLVQAMLTKILAQEVKQLR